MIIKQYRAGVSSGPSGNGDLNGSLKKITVAGPDGIFYDIGIQTVKPEYLGAPFKYMYRSGSYYGTAEGRLFYDWPGSSPTPPFHGLSDTKVSELKPPGTGTAEYVWQGYWGGVDFDEAMSCFQYDWEQCTVGGSDLVELAFSYWRNNWPEPLLYAGGSDITCEFPLVGFGENVESASVRVSLSLLALDTVAPSEEEKAYLQLIEGTFNDWTYRVNVLDEPSWWGQISATFLVRMKGSFNTSRMETMRRGVNYGSAVQHHVFGYSGFALMDRRPRIVLTAMPFGVTTATNDEDNFFSTADPYISSTSWPYVARNTSSFSSLPSLDDLNAEDVPRGYKKARVYRTPGYGQFVR